MLLQIVEKILKTIETSEAEYAANACFEELRARIEEFGNDPDKHYSISIRLPDFPTFRVNSVCFRKPYIVVFSGEVEGEVDVNLMEVKVIQHVNQVNVMLVKERR